MTSLKAMLRLHYVNFRFSLIIFWSIMLTIFAVTIVLAGLYADSSVSVTGGFTSIFIYAFIGGLLTFKETFPYAIGMNIRRKDYFFGTFLFFSGTTLFIALLTYLFNMLEMAITKNFEANISFFSLGLTAPLSSGNQMLIILAVTYQVLALGFLISVIAGRFGKMGVLGLGAAILLGIILLSLYDGWGSIANLLSKIGSIPEFTLWLTLLSFIWYGITYLLLRKMTAKA